MSMPKTVLPLLTWLLCGPVLSAAQSPNILFILADDLSWSDLGCYGHPYHQTPNLDRLAEQGMRFTQAYAPAPICSAARAAFLTGKTPARLHFEFVTKDKPGSQNLRQPLQSPPYPTDLPLEEVTIAEVLSPAGYHTAFFGKWHLNKHHGGYLGWSPTHGPLQQGFAEGHADFGGHPYAYRTETGLQEALTPAGEYPPDSLTDRALRFIRAQRNERFFLYLSHYYVHDPVHSRCQWLVDEYRRKLPTGTEPERATYAAMVETLDYEVGRVTGLLLALGLHDNTLIVFTSDNGGHPNHTANAPHRGSKWNLYEGGIRVPFIVRWPGHTPAGVVCDQPVHGCDLLPTFAALAGTQSGPVDGISLAPLFRDENHMLPQRAMIWHFPFYHPESGFAKAPAKIGANDFVTSQTRPHSAIRLGRHKLLHFYEDGRDELYDLETDPGESRDLATAKPLVTTDLRDQLDEYLKKTRARLPTAKPAQP